MSTSAVALEPAAVAPPSLRQRQWLQVLRVASRLTRTRIGLGIVTADRADRAVRAAGRAAFADARSWRFRIAGPSSHAIFGADALGRDVLSRFLYGGRTVIGLAVLTTVLGVSLGLAIGLTAAYAGGMVDEVLMRICDVFLAFPQILFALLLVSALGPKLYLLVLAVGLTTAPRVARVMRGAGLQVVERDFVKAAEAVGEKRSRIIFGELLPNVTSPLLVEIGLRLTYSIGLVAAISFLGFGLQPPRADWGLMINENRLSITVQPWAVVLPVLAIALLTVGTNLVTDGIARAAIGLDRGSES